MPTGPYIRRRADTGFRGEIRDKYMSAYYWIEWITSESGKQIQHKLNSGREKLVGPFSVDGYTIFQFHECFFHGHDCVVTKNVKSGKWHKTKSGSYQKTKDITKFLRQEVYNVNEIWECEYNQLKHLIKGTSE